MEVVQVWAQNVAGKPATPAGFKSHDKMSALGWKARGWWVIREIFWSVFYCVFFDSVIPLWGNYPKKNNYKFVQLYSLKDF